MAGEKILVVDDEVNIIDLARMYLERDGFQVCAASDGAQALEEIKQQKPDLVVLDIMLPEIDGFEVCQRVRKESEVPIIMLTARDDDVDKIVGLELGADDYMTKPFNPRELVARVKAILRRMERNPREDAAPVNLGDLSIDPASREVRVDRDIVNLRTKEFDLLLTFCEHRSIVLTREQMLELVWGFDFYGQTRTVDVHVANLRKRLSKSKNVRIETITGVGYKLVCE